METFTMATFITSIGSALTALLGWLGQIFTFVVSQPVLLTFVCLVIAISVLFLALKLIPRKR